MFNQRWFKILIWFFSSFYFFILTCLLISIFGAPASEQQIQQWMSGMMEAMKVSLMGYSMQLEEGGDLAVIMFKTSQAIIPLILGGGVLGLLYRLKKGYGN